MWVVPIHCGSGHGSILLDQNSGRGTPHPDYDMMKGEGDLDSHQVPPNPNNHPTLRIGKIVHRNLGAPTMYHKNKRESSIPLL